MQPGQCVYIYVCVCVCVVCVVPQIAVRLKKNLQAPANTLSFTMPSEGTCVTYLGWLCAIGLIECVGGNFLRSGMMKPMIHHGRIFWENRRISGCKMIVLMLSNIFCSQELKKGEWQEEKKTEGEKNWGKQDRVSRQTLLSWLRQE